MSDHIIRINETAKSVPTKSLPDGAIAGNGDVSVVLGGSADRVKLYISKADFWKADGRVYTSELGGLGPICMAEILLPQLAYAKYEAEQNLDEAYIGLHLTEGKLSADLKITVCAEDNTIILELEHTHPVVSTSISLMEIRGTESENESGSYGDVTYTVRGFNTAECRYPTYGICALKEISRTVSQGRERIVWALCVCTNHDTASYKAETLEKADVLDADICAKYLAEHSTWWKDFWSKSSVSLQDKQIELYWYSGLYAIACCSRNKKFPPGLWGTYSTADGMDWFGDYHLNYNYEAPFYVLTSLNHTELLEGYSAPLRDFLPQSKKYARQYLGIDGAFYPVSIAPLGLEPDLRPDTKEHGHLFHGQKSNGAYAMTVPMMHWYGTRDKAFAKREYYGLLLDVATFWENYLVFEDGYYQIYNDALNEVMWYVGPDAMPEGHDDKNPIVSCALVRMVMKMAIEISEELGLNLERIPKWRHIIENMAPLNTMELDGKLYLQGVEGVSDVRELALEAVYPACAIGKYSTPELFEAAVNTHKYLKNWNSNNRFWSYYPMAARFDYPPEEIFMHIRELIDKKALPNGMFRFAGGGLENSVGVPATVLEMLLQSYEGILRLFPVWDRNSDASFTGFRTFGAFLVDGKLENGRISAEILSEQGMSLALESPGEGYVLVRGDGSRISLSEGVTTTETQKGERLKVLCE